ncbi:MAG: SAM-dependent methyltransferase [bacterium]
MLNQVTGKDPRMPFQLSHVVPWGRSFEEYVAMFALSHEDLQKSILGCGDGPASFNAALTKRGGTIVSVDPLYAFQTAQIKQRIDDTFDAVIAETQKNRQEFVWKHIKSVDELGRVRMAAMNDFLLDFERGKRTGRYVAQSFPFLEFSDGQFDLALCSHLLFLYSDHFDLSFHINSIREMCRVAREARIFPLLQLGTKPSVHLQSVIHHFEEQGYEISVVDVSYEFQKGGNQMLRVARTHRCSQMN